MCLCVCVGVQRKEVMETAQGSSEYELAQPLVAILGKVSPCTRLSVCTPSHSPDHSNRLFINNHKMQDASREQQQQQQQEARQAMDSKGTQTQTHTKTSFTPSPAYTLESNRQGTPPKAYY